MYTSHLLALLSELTDSYEATDGLQVYVNEQLIEQKRALQITIERVGEIISQQPAPAVPVEMPCSCGEMHDAGHGDCGCQHCDV